MLDRTFAADMAVIWNVVGCVGEGRGCFLALEEVPVGSILQRIAAMQTMIA